MLTRAFVSLLVLATTFLLTAAPAMAQGEVTITQAKANAGGVTPGDAPGFPVTISRPGAYVLAGNLDAPAGEVALRVTTSNVDIDLNGFRLFGANEAFHGLHSTGGESRIHDGVISGFQRDGILLSGSGTNSWVVENIQVVNNGGVGIRTSGNYARIINSSILFNGIDGINCGDYCHIEGNIISSNGRLGVFIGFGVVLGNTIQFNNHFGVANLSEGPIAIGNNSISGNNSGGDQVRNVRPLDPNYCEPASVLC